MAITKERKLLLLGLLRKSDMHGYLLNAHLDGSVPISLKKPTAYNLLDLMEKDGWVEHRDEPTGDRPRRVFSVTERGERAFQSLLREQLGGFTPAEFPSAVSLSFLDTIPAGDALTLLRHRRRAVERCREQVMSPDGGESTSDAHHGGSAHLALEYVRRFYDMELRILDEVIARLETNR